MKIGVFFIDYKLSEKKRPQRSSPSRSLRILFFTLRLKSGVRNDKNVLVQAHLSSICEKPFPVSQFICNKTRILLVIIQLFSKVSSTFSNNKRPQRISPSRSLRILIFTLRLKSGVRNDIE